MVGSSEMSVRFSLFSRELIFSLLVQLTDRISLVSTYQPL